jgi:hypothetical protein
MSRADRDAEDIVLFDLGYSQHIFDGFDYATRNSVVVGVLLDTTTPRGGTSNF